MPLKLLQAEQSAMINKKLPNGHAIVLNGDNNKESTQCEIARGHYTHVFTSPEIALSKKFKKNILDQHLFTDRLCLLAVDEIHLVKEWGRQFRPLYAEIEKVQKRIPNDVPLVGVSVTLTPAVCTKVIKKAGFLPTYKLMQTSLGRPEIMQVHRFMKHAKSSCLDLQFILPKSANKAKDIQKTVVFVNSVTEIRPMISILQSWMKYLGYPKESSKWIRPYYSALSDWDKGLTAAAFAVAADENEEYVILVATDAYGMGIDNPDVKLVIQWDIPLSFDSTIQRMGRAGRKGSQSTFVLFTPKWSEVKDPKEIDKRMATKNHSSSSTASHASSQLSDSNRSKHSHPSPLSQMTTARDTNGSDTESAAGSVTSSVADFEADGFDLEDADLFSGLIITDADENQLKKKKARQASKSDAQKRANLPDEIFDYIHVARCKRLFSLAWYGDMTYAEETLHNNPSQLLETPSRKALPEFCYNGPSCKSQEPDYILREPFINTVPTKHTEAEREWIACRTAGLKSWRKEASLCLLSEKVVKLEMPNNALMSDSCLMALAKDGGQLQDLTSLQQFLQPWSRRIATYSEEILLCFQKNSAPQTLDSKASVASLPSDLSIIRPTKTERKAILKATRASKKLKYMDDPLVAEEAHAIALRDTWLIEKGNPPPETKARMRKAVDAEKKLVEKQTKAQEKAKAKNLGPSEMMKLAIANRHAEAEIGSFKNILSDPAAPENEDNPTLLSVENQVIKSANSGRQTLRQQRIASTQSKVGRLSRQSGLGQAVQQARSPTPPPPLPPVQRVIKESCNTRIVQ
ncbi:hypothetical protein MMC31_006699 [Peltigera leucophlebia]|nr:hypothetical protein [Peltigera leucophlebia]